MYEGKKAEAEAEEAEEEEKEEEWFICFDNNDGKTNNGLTLSFVGWTDTSISLCRNSVTKAVSLHSDFAIGMD